VEHIEELERETVMVRLRAVSSFTEGETIRAQRRTGLVAVGQEPERPARGQAEDGQPLRLWREECADAVRNRVEPLAGRIALWHHADMTHHGGTGARWDAPRHNWGGRFIALSLLAGIGSAIFSYVAIAGSWGNCDDGLEAGGAFAVNFEGLAGFVVMPTVATLFGTAASAAHLRLNRSPRLQHLDETIPKLITAAGALTLIVLIALWIAWGNPPEGYCKNNTP
jgi:hypothetical protein